ncbi:MAG: hypothetical protein IJZ37_00210 [Clostridia bacterium]|nr:hypothetical protein [Clostridia bacterium]
MKIIKDNFYTVIKLWVNQFAMMFLGILILLPTAGADVPKWLMPVASAFTGLFYLALIFLSCCELGLQHNVSIDIGKMKRDPKIGFLLSLTANLPVIICSIISCISKAFIPGVAYLESPLDAMGVAADFYGISTTINELLHMMYKGLLLFFDFNRLPFIHLPLAALSILVCTLGYVAGTKGYFATLFAKRRDN